MGANVELKGTDVYSTTGPRQAKKEKRGHGSIHQGPLKRRIKLSRGPTQDSPAWR